MCRQILTGEDWNEVMYQGIRSQGGNRGCMIYSLYFIILIMIGEDWNEVMYQGIRSQGGNRGGMIYSLYFIILILTGEDWNEVMYQGIRSQGGNNSGGMIYSLYFIILILTGEDWNEVMYQGIRSQGGNNSEGMIYSLYFIILVLFGNYTLLNVFLAIAVDNLANAQELTAAEEEQEEEDKEKQQQELEKEMGVLHLMAGEGSATNLEMSPAYPATKFKGGEKGGDDDDMAGPKPMLPYSSMFIFSPTNPIRRGAHFVVNLKYFDFFIMVVISLSSIALAAEDPVDENSFRNTVLMYFDYAFTGHGLRNHPPSRLVLAGVLELYGRCCGHLCCCVIRLRHVSVSLTILTSLSLCSSGKKAQTNLSTIKSLRVLRVLRPLKTIKRVPKLKAVFDCVVNSLKNVINILIVYILFQFIFAVIAVQLFNGKFFYCTDESKFTKEDCHGQYFVFEEGDTPEALERLWKTQSFHYDNVMAAMLTLFAVQTGEGWPQVLQNSMATTQDDHGPIQNYRIEMSIFYIVYFVVFPFFFVNIFVALIIITFQEQGEAELQDGEIDKNQKSCIDFTIGAKPLERYMPNKPNSFKYKVWRIVVSTPFEYFIMMLIVFNTLLLMMKSLSVFQGSLEPQQSLSVFQGSLEPKQSLSVFQGSLEPQQSLSVFQGSLEPQQSLSVFQGSLEPQQSLSVFQGSLEPQQSLSVFQGSLEPQPSLSVFQGALEPQQSLSVFQDSLEFQ
uniref:Ion transport domain-containing protein n=1 Tax=Timema bartmani TaxID=61472 RepID=A0A7R9I596_9NEOP|nr:unnamed protein product [Timema bartmani]